METGRQIGFWEKKEKAKQAVACNGYVQYTGGMLESWLGGDTTDPLLTLSTPAFKNCFCVLKTVLIRVIIHEDMKNNDGISNTSSSEKGVESQDSIILKTKYIVKHRKA